MRFTVLALLIASPLVAGCGGGGDADDATRNEAAAPAHRSPEGRGTLGDHLAGASDHRRLVELLRGSALIETLNGAGVYTIFAPTDSAFAALPADVQARLAAPDQREGLITLLSYHIVPGTVTADDLARAVAQAPGGRAELATVTGRTLTISREGDALVVGDGAGARGHVLGSHNVAANGVVHAVDAVLMPEG